MTKLILIILLSIYLHASYSEGRSVFKKKCLSCHKEYIKQSILINNFKNNNKILNLKAPAFNRLVYKIKHGKKAIINDIDLIESQKEDIIEYLKTYHIFPKFSNSVSSLTSRSFYKIKKRNQIKLTDNEYLNITDYIFDYDKYFISKINTKKQNISDEELLSESQLYNKKILILVVTKKCYRCKYLTKMISKDLDLKEKIISKYIFNIVYLNKNILPFGISNSCFNNVPAFLIIDKKGEIITINEKIHNKNDFLNLLKSDK